MAAVESQKPAEVGEPVPVKTDLPKTDVSNVASDASAPADAAAAAAAPASEKPASDAATTTPNQESHRERNAQSRGGRRSSGMNGFGGNKHQSSNNNKNQGSSNKNGTGGRSGSDVKKSDKGQSKPAGDGKGDEEKKFSTRSRLFVGNLSSDTTEQDIKKMFGEFSPASPPEVFLDKQKMFAFVRVDTRLNAEKAKSAIDGMTFKGRVVRVRFASHSAGIKVKNMGQNVCNELLQRAFERFGEIDKAVISVDEKGRPCGEGIVYFSRKPAAMQALHRVNEGIFLLGASPRPVVAEVLEEKDVEDGMAEIHIANRQSYQNEITEPPHFAVMGSLEYEFGMRWKKLLDNHQAQLQQIERIFQTEAEELEKEMEKSIDDFEINKIKQTIAQETQKMRQLEERKAQRRPGGPSMNSQQQNMQHHQQQHHQQQSAMRNGQTGPQLQGLPPAPPGFGLGQGLRLQGPGGPQFMEPFGSMGGTSSNMLVLPNGGFLPGGPMGQGGLPLQRMPGQFGGGAPHPFELQQQQQHFDPNLSGLGQRQPDFDFKRGGGGEGRGEGRGGDSKRPRN